jgi:hypothetical protein
LRSATALFCTGNPQEYDRPRDSAPNPVKPAFRPQEIYATAEDGRVWRAARRGCRRWFSRIGGGGEVGGVTFITACGTFSTATVIGIAVSIEARNARPATVICQPAWSRTTNDWLKISRSGARAAKPFVRSVHSRPLEIRIATARLSSPSDMHPSGCPAKTFKTVI